MRVPPFPRELEAIATLREPNRRRLYRYVERQPQAVSRDEAAAATGLSRVVAAFHLDKLVHAGLLRTEFRRLSGRSGPGAGRTSKLYRRSRHQFEMSLPARHYQMLARLLAESISSGQAVSPERGPAHEYGRALGRRAAQRIRGRREPDRLLMCVEDVLGSLGFEPFRADPGEVRLRNCPFDPLSRLYTPLVCGISQAIMVGVVQGIGADQLHVSRRMRPERCCGIVTSTESLTTS
jgi:predicted ArsR family transcriptional regulator